MHTVRNFTFGEGKKALTFGGREGRGAKRERKGERKGVRGGVRENEEAQGRSSEG